MTKLIFIICIFFTVFYKTLSQELKCNVQVVANEIQGTNKQVFQTLQSELYEFMNNTSWTNHVFSNEERIECNFLLRINNQTSDEFSGTLQIQARRPVYNSSYKTTLINLIDNNVYFQYVEYEPLEFNPASYISNLTSLFAFYAYIVLGFDYDSFSLEGGTPFFQIAEKIVNNAQNAKETAGWLSYESNKKNRYWLVENLLSDKYSSLREFTYNYHRLGLDRMSEKINEARVQISEDLLLLRKIYREKPSLSMPFFDIILDAKSDEFVDIFSESFPDEKARVVNILSEIDPSNQEKYRKIISSGN